VHHREVAVEAKRDTHLYSFPFQWTWHWFKVVLKSAPKSLP